MKQVDLLLRDGRIIDVLYGEISQPTNVAIKDCRIVGIGDSYEAKNKIDVQGKFLVPGFGDLHVHIESTMLRPTYAIKTFLPHGTTYIVHDPHEVANVDGLNGIISMISETEHLPCHTYTTIPSCVPATPPEMGLETSGSYIGVNEVRSLMGCKMFVGLGEVMDVPGVLNKEEKIMKKIEIARKHQKIVEGHAPGLTGDDLKRYVEAGIESDHEVTSFDEAMERIKLGMYVEVREGSASHDLEPIISGFVKRGGNTDKLVFCSDDINTHDLVSRGHIDHNIRKSINLGMNPVEAFRIASYNGYRRLKMEKRGAIEEDYVADLVVISTPDNTSKTLKRFKVDKTVYNGHLVVNNGELVTDLPEKKYGSDILNSVNLAKKYEPKDFTINIGLEYAKKKAQVRIIGLQNDKLETKELIEEMYTENGILHPNLEKNILKAFVIGRHDGLVTSKGNVGYGFIKNMGLSEGAISSSIGHDCHNIIVTGTNSWDMSVAVNRQQQIGGGIVLVENSKVTREIPLKYYGLMSTKRAEEVCDEQKKLNERLYELGSRMENPAMKLAFVPLTVIPELRLTDKGLVKNYQIVPLIVEAK